MTAWTMDLSAMHCIISLFNSMVGIRMDLFRTIFHCSMPKPSLVSSQNTSEKEDVISHKPKNGTVANSKRERESSPSARAHWHEV